MALLLEIVEAVAPLSSMPRPFPRIVQWSSALRYAPLPVLFAMVQPVKLQKLAPPPSNRHRYLPLRIFATTRQSFKVASCAPPPTPAEVLFEITQWFAMLRDTPPPPPPPSSNSDARFPLMTQSYKVPWYA